MPKIFKVYFLCFLCVSSLSFSLTLEELIENPGLLVQLIADGGSITDLENKTSNKKINTIRRKYSKALKLLKKQEINLKKSNKKKKAKPKKNKSFYGDPEAAYDATIEDLNKYQMMLDALDELLLLEQINESTYAIVCQILDDLRFFHGNNKQICHEFYYSSSSETYGNRLHLHPEEREVPFELQAGIMLGSLYSAVLLAQENGLLADFFTHGLGRTSGCLAARVDGAAKWQRKMQTQLSAFEAMSPDSKAVASRQTSGDFAFSVIQADFEEFGEVLEDDDIDPVVLRNRLAKKLGDEYGYMKDCNGDWIKTSDFKNALKTIFMINSPTRIKTGDGVDETFIVADEFDADDLITANMNSHLGVQEVRTLAGEEIPCQIRPVAANGNCGFAALRADRDNFINHVLSVVEHSAISDRLRLLINTATREAGVETLDQWAAEFRSAGYWMNDVHLEMWAILNNATVQIYALDHEANIFVPVQTLNPDHDRIFNLVHMNLNPVLLGQGGHNLGNNHFVELVIEPEDDEIALCVDDDDGDDDDMFYMDIDFEDDDLSDNLKIEGLEVGAADSLAAALIVLGLGPVRSAVDHTSSI